MICRASVCALEFCESQSHHLCILSHSYYDTIQSLPKLDQHEMDSYLTQASRVSEISATYTNVTNVMNNVSTDACVKNRRALGGLYECFTFQIQIPITS